MNLADIFEQLAYGELSQSFSSEKELGGHGLRVDARRKVLAHVKMGLTELHKRFLLRERSLTLEMVKGKVGYILDREFATSNTESTAPNKYLIDDPDEPFANEALFKIERVTDAAGEELTLNEVGNPDALRTPTYNKLVVPDDLKMQSLTVTYRAGHPPIDGTNVEDAPETIEIALPGTHLEALLYYVAMRHTNPLGTAGEFHEGNNYAGKFEASVARLKQLNYETDKGGTNTRFHDNGFV